MSLVNASVLERVFLVVFDIVQKNNYLHWRLLKVVQFRKNCYMFTMFLESEKFIFIKFLCTFTSKVKLYFLRAVWRIVKLFKTQYHINRMEILFQTNKRVSTVHLAVILKDRHNISNMKSKILSMHKQIPLSL